MIKEEIAKQLKRVCLEQWPELKDKLSDDFFIKSVDYTKDDKFGDVSTTVAMQLSKKMSQNPLELADAITNNLSQNFKKKIVRVEVVVPGFINFYLSKAWLGSQVGMITELDRSYGKADKGQKEKVQVEFISANPTGPLHLGNGRGAFMGDTLANILSSQGYKVQREYLINDIGNQVELLAESVIRRYFQNQGLKVDYPERCYQGKYVTVLARDMKLGDVKLRDINRIKKRIRQKVLKLMVAEIQKLTQEKLNIKYHKWFYESDLYSKGTTKEVMTSLQQKDLLYKKDGAKWVKTSEYGDEKDRVIVKANREYTYFISDIAYHWDKFVNRKFDRVVNIWGADHQGHVIRMQSIKKAMEMPGDLDIIIVQLVRLISQKQEVKMSKRSGTFVTLEELVSDVGLDVARFFFLMRAADTHMDFDLDLAKEKSEKNPVYYVQYAHARICSIIKQPELKKKPKKTITRLIYDHRSEYELIKELVRYPDLLSDISQTYEVHRLPFYTIKLAELFHNFYAQCRVIDNGDVNHSRVALVKATRIVLRNSLKMMGVSAPTKM